MNNPFIIDGYLSTNASINKLFISKIPTDKVRQNIEGKAAYEIFSTDLFIEEIKKNSEKLNLDIVNIEGKMIPYYFNDCLKSADNSVKELADGIVKVFGERLAVILLTLKTGNKENRLKRQDWTDDNWEYWSQLDNIILVGGLASSNIGERFKYHIEDVFKKSNEKCYNIILNNDPGNAAIKGCSTYIKNGDLQKVYLIFDLGQSFIKRSIVHVKGNELKDIKNLNKVLSRYVQWEFEKTEDEKNMAVNLNNYILNVIKDSISEAESNGKEVGEYIVLSIANYVKKGKFVNRGGYGKLRLISDDYEYYLSNELYKIYNKKFTIKFIHDGTAMAGAFENYPNSVCISLGTAFGIGFTK